MEDYGYSDSKDESLNENLIEAMTGLNSYEIRSISKSKKMATLWFRNSTMLTIMLLIYTDFINLGDLNTRK